MAFVVARFRARQDRTLLCRACGRVYMQQPGEPWLLIDRVVESPGGVKDFTWAHATPDPATGGYFIQCWGCGATRSFTQESHPGGFIHRVECSMPRAAINRARRTMPVPNGDCQ